ncbi:MAG: class I SAM-dependent methyltransferase [Panacagrimonas sp.]
MRTLSPLIAASLLAVASWTVTAGQSLEDVIAGKHRPAENRARDVYRHPLETLRFFDIKPDQRVVEVWPGGGWYTEILAPYLRESGQYIAAGFVVDASTPKYRVEMMESLVASMAASPEIYGKPIVTALGAPSAYEAAPAGTVDRVLTFRNVHNWLKAGYEAPMFKAFYDALKPGGVLGVVEHRARPGTPLEKMKASGYVTEAKVIELATAAGFTLDSRSEINANPKDSADHPEGVWTLPPILRLGDKDREKYLAIGESDRMTLRFVKPKAE